MKSVANLMLSWQQAALALGLGVAGALLLYLGLIEQASEPAPSAAASSREL
jgi:hypothetical protein